MVPKGVVALIKNLNGHIEHPTANKKTTTEERKKIAGFKMYFFTKQKMKFCKKCHRRVVEQIENHVGLSMGSLKICVCSRRATLINCSVLKRLVSEVGVHEIKKCMA